MIAAGDFKNGVTFEMDGNVMQVIEFLHVKPGKGAAFVRTKLKNVITGSTIERSFSPNEKFPLAYIQRDVMQYSYSEGDVKYFLDSNSYEMVSIDSDKLGSGFSFIKENTEVKVLSYKGKIFGVELPNFVVLKVIDTQPGVKGNTATNATKNAIVETGAQVKVPLFIEEGESIKIDTRTGEYIERA